ncbi:MAG: UDP-glucose 4-epimerase GalE [Acidimicrobiales bacterium]
MTVLVTGGAGYIGSHTVRLLRERGREVVVLDSLELGHRAAVLDAPLVVGRVDDEPLVEKLVEEFGVDAVIHFAAYKSAGESMHEPEKYFRNNVGGSLGLLEALRRSGVRRFVFSSTAATYGTPETLPVPEGHALAPESPYGESKLMVERILHWYDTAHDLRSVSLRYFNAAGASRDARIGEDSSTTTNLIPLVMKAALGRLPALSVFGTDYPTSDGTAIRDYIHVDDLADAHLKALEYLEHDGATTVINVGTGTGSSVQDVIDMVRKVSGVEIPVSYVGRRAGDPVAVYADNRKARELLGWLPDHSFENVVASAWAWHSTHPDGYVE